MFNSKKSTLQSDKIASVKPKTPNAFLAEAGKSSAETLSENGALKYSTTGSDFVDQFGKLGSYKLPRSYDNIATDASTLWGHNPRLSVVFIFFIRMITRVVSLFDGTKTETVQRGAGLKYESITRMIWLHVNHPDTFWKNITLFISVGAWKDIFQMLSFDLQHNGWDGRVLDWNKMGQLILAGLENPNNNQLLKKYLPQIKANSKCITLEAQANNIIAKWICSLLYGGKGLKDDYKNYKSYRQLKSSGTAHVWQQLISNQKFLEINFDTVHGRALSQLVSGKFIENQNLTEKYDAWISSKPVAKFTGYAHELFKKIPNKKYQVATLNAQFMGLVETAKKGAIISTGMIVVRDTSGSMTQEATGTGMSCFHVAKALALYFSHMLSEGKFANSWIEFASGTTLHTWKGSTPFEKWTNDTTNHYGSTDFQSVISLLVLVKSKGVDESEFPTGILCLSDSEFNPAMLGKTNVEIALQKLRLGGFSEEYVSNFKIVLWNLSSHTYYGRPMGDKFETHGDVKNVFYFSGYEASTIAFLTGIEGTAEEEQTPSTAGELFTAAMEQEVLHRIEI